jgi:hypothetical protein
VGRKGTGEGIFATFSSNSIASVFSQGVTFHLLAFHKAFWIFLVFVSFLAAGYLINDSFTSWSLSPTISSAKTYPLSQVQFPQVTVCPPEGSNTALNYDLNKAQDTILDDETRNELTLLAFELMHQHDHEKFKNLVSGVVEDEQLSLLYSEYRKMTLLQYFSERAEWSIKTSGGQGLCSSPAFGEERNSYNFIKEMSVYLEVSLPDTVDTILMINLTMDTKETKGGSEAISIISWKNQSMISNKRFSYTGLKSVEYELDIRERVEGFNFLVDFRRTMSESDLIGWDHSLVTGVSVQWYFTNSDGIRQDVFMEPKFSSENNKFRIWINLVKFFLAETNISLSELKQVVQKEKVLWIDKNPNLEKLKKESCYHGMLFEDKQDLIIAGIKGKLKHQQKMLTKKTSTAPTLTYTTGKSCTENCLQPALQDPSYKL